MDIRLKRAYDPAEADDGFRVYIDRLWPRGLSREKFRYDWWDKDLAPSTELRRWFHADPDGRWPEFVRRYEAELRGSAAFHEFMKAIHGKPRVTLLYSSRNREENNAVVVAQVLGA